MNKVSVFYNGAYKEDPGKFPRQATRIARMAGELDRLHVDRHFLPMYFQGENPDQVHANLITQVRGYLNEIIDDKKIFFGGDGFVGAMINAFGQARDEFADHSRMAAQKLDADPVMVAKGGSLNLFSKRLGSDNLEVLADFVDDLHKIVIPTKRRIFQLAAIDEKEAYEDQPRIKRTQSYPFSFFTGVGTDALMVKLQEEQSRTTHWFLNTMKITNETVQNLWNNSSGYHIDTLMTIPYWVLMRFPKKFDSLSEAAFFRFQSDARTAFEASKKMLLGHLAMSNPLTAKWFLESGQDYCTLNKIRSMENELVRANHPEGLVFYTDGFPLVFPLQKGEAALYSATTVDAPAVQVASFVSSDTNPQEDAEFQWKCQENIG
jgi:hypothetical protein